MIFFGFGLLWCYISGNIILLNFQYIENKFLPYFFPGFTKYVQEMMFYTC